MATKKTYTYSTERGPRGHLSIYCDEQETRRIADASAAVSDWIFIFSPFVEPMTYTAIKAMAALVAWKARRALAHGKCLEIVVAGIIAFPVQYDPSERPWE